MDPKLGPGTDNGRRAVVGERALTIDSPTVVPQRRHGPAEGPVAAVATLVVLLLLAGGLVTIRHLRPAEPAASDSTLQSTLCWDGSGRGETGCPKLEGEAAMQWLFTAQPDFAGCEPRNDVDVQAGELEAWHCRWSDLDAEVLLSRWDKAKSAADYYGFYAGPPARVDVGSGPDSGLVFATLTPREGGQPIQAFAYAGHPYSYLVMGPEAQRDLAVDRMSIRPPSQIVQ